MFTDLIIRMQSPVVEETFNPRMTVPFRPLITMGPDGDKDEAPLSEEATGAGELLAMPAMAIVLAIGENITLNVRLWPVFNATGEDTPEAANGSERLMLLTVIGSESLLGVVNI